MNEIKKEIVIQNVNIFIILIIKINIIVLKIHHVQMNTQNLFKKKLNVFIDVIETIYINLNVIIILVALIVQMEKSF